jgi:hypothetical protein
MDEKEVWKKVIGYEDFYEVSNLGRVRSLDRICHSDKRSSQLQKGKILKYRINTKRQNRCTVCLWKTGKVKYCYVSRLVLEAFVGPPGYKQEAAHWDGNTMNNNLNNLRWASHSDNLLDRKRTNTETIGSRNGTSKLTEEQALEIKKLYKRTSYHKSNAKELSKKFNVTISVILSIASNKTWKHVTLKEG